MTFLSLNKKSLLPTSDALKLVLRILLGVNLDTSLAATEGHINTGTLVGHKGGQGLNLVSAHIH